MEITQPNDILLRDLRRDFSSVSKIICNQVDAKVNSRFFNAGAASGALTNEDGSVKHYVIFYNDEVLDKVVQSYVKDGFSIEDAKETVKAFIYLNRLK